MLIMKNSTGSIKAGKDKLRDRFKRIRYAISLDYEDDVEKLFLKGPLRLRLNLLSYIAS